MTKFVDNNSACLKQNEALIHHILLSDIRGGEVNRHNYRIWSKVKVTQTLSKSQHIAKLCVWFVFAIISHKSLLFRWYGDINYLSFKHGHFRNDLIDIAHYYTQS